jgi:hypothetical protein
MNITKLLKNETLADIIHWLFFEILSYYSYRIYIYNY